MADALNTAAHAGYVKTFGAIIFNKSQHGMSLQMTDLAQGRKLVASVRAQNPKWSAVSVALVKVPYTEKRMQTALRAVPEALYRKYQLVSVGFGTGQYLDVTSSDTRLKDPVAGRKAREALAQTLGTLVGVRVQVSYSTTASPA